MDSAVSWSFEPLTLVPPDSDSHCLNMQWQSKEDITQLKEFSMTLSRYVFALCFAADSSPNFSREAEAVRTTFREIHPAAIACQGSSKL